MKQVLSIWPEQTFTTAELTQLAGYLSQPVVKKYFLQMVIIHAHALATGGPDYKGGQTNDQYLFEEARVQGSLDVIDKLMKFEYPAQPGSPEEDE